jgi:hypothetical protein
MALFYGFGATRYETQSCFCVACSTKTVTGEVSVHTTKFDGGAEVEFHAFLTSAIDRGEYSISTHRPIQFLRTGGFASKEIFFCYALRIMLCGSQNHLQKCREEKTASCPCQECNYCSSLAHPTDRL